MGLTDPTVQGKGFAGFLIERSINALKEHGYSEFYLVVTEGNTPAQNLYRRALDLLAHFWLTRL